MFPIDNDTFDSAVKRLGIMSVADATIRQICSLAAELEKASGEEMIHLEIGNPGLQAEQIGTDAEIAILKEGIANTYPPIPGIPALKTAGHEFISRFLGVDINPQGIIPTVGSMQGAYTLQLILSQRLKEAKDTMLFLNPGFPAHMLQAKVIGLKIDSFDIYNYRGKAMEAELERHLASGKVTGIIYSNPNNPAWTNLTEEELEIIGRLATKYDAIVLEDLAYFGMDFRHDIMAEGARGVTIANYTDNYILLLSASKIFSYAGQRIALVCIGNKVYEREYEDLKEMYGILRFGDAYVLGVLYCCSSGTAHSAQYALAAMLKAAVEKRLPFTEHCSEYARRAEVMKRLFEDNGFHIVYDKDGDNPIADGFFFTIGYGDMTGAELQEELMKYGISSIALATTGSEQPGIRACVSMVSSDEQYRRMENFLKKFNEDHKAEHK